jgi:hypothetical protein
MLAGLVNGESRLGGAFANNCWSGCKRLLAGWRSVQVSCSRGERLGQRASPELRIEREELCPPHLGSSGRSRLHGRVTTVVIPWFAERYAEGADWRAMAWWIHDHLPYRELHFFPYLEAFNICYHYSQNRRIYSFIPPR